MWHYIQPKSCFKSSAVSVRRHFKIMSKYQQGMAYIIPAGPGLYVLDTLLKKISKDGLLLSKRNLIRAVPWRCLLLATEPAESVLLLPVSLTLCWPDVSADPLEPMRVSGCRTGTASLHYHFIGSSDAHPWASLLCRIM